MAIPITVPRLGWSMDDGVFVGWLKADGATIRAGDALFTLESEKATEDVECLDDGVLHIPAHGPRKGDGVAVGAVIGFVLQPGEPIPREGEAPAEPSERKVETRTEESRLGGSLALAKHHRGQQTSSPRARRAAAKLGVDWRDANGTGRTGRIRERDVLALATPGHSTRRIIAERMLESHRSTAPVTLMTTIDATNLVHLRTQWKGDPIPSYTDFFVKAAATALAQHAALNSRWENDRVVASDGIHIGIAVDTDVGLLVPVVRDVTQLSISELPSRTRDLIERARRGKLAIREMQSGTFTVTSLGAFGIDAFTPIINYPECAILGIGRIRRCPAVFEDRIVIRDQVTLCLTFDHRIVDGAPAARFMQTLAALIEEPAFV
jgi:pyruvate dehydrogenase E2 component (dihydrolipoamide acetyltransferase)